MPAPIAALAQEMLKQPVEIALQRRSAPAVGITQAVYPVAQHLKAPLLAALLKRGILKQALVFTRTKHRANRLAAFLVEQRIAAERIHGNRSQGQRTEALAGFKSGKYPVLVATDIAARGIDVEALSHVVNFDVPLAPADYIHRVGRTGRAEMTGEAFTFAAPDEEADLRAIEKAIAKGLPRVTLPDFDYRAQHARPLEVPRAQRIAEIRARKAEERARGREKEARRAAQLRQPGAPQRAPQPTGSGQAQQQRPGAPRRRGGRFRPRRRRH
jgi:ATP-dependent RNA helicase RhlE